MPFVLYAEDAMFAKIVNIIIDMKKQFKIAGRIFLSALCVAVLLVANLYAYPVLNAQIVKQPEGYAGVLRLWHIDGFEGGKGARSSFLQRAASYYEEQGGMLVLVTVHTAESAAREIEAGNTPDLISFGGAAEFVADVVRPLKGYSFGPAEIGDTAYAYPWCRGNYFLFSADGNYSDASAENTVISAGRGASAEAAACYAGMQGEYSVEPSVQAYVHWIDGKYRYMVGTQRDVQRLITRGVAFQVQPLSAYNDLMQYIAICSDDAAHYNAALNFVESLLSEKTQQMLTQIGMLSMRYSIYDAADPLSVAESYSAKTLPAFLSDNARTNFYTAARSALRGDENGAKNLQNFLL